jgi:hypothetical protein
MDELLVVIAVGLAVLYVARRAYRKFKVSQESSCGCECSSCPVQNDTCPLPDSPEKKNGDT